MKVVIVNTYSNRGGAAIATFRLHRGLLSIGVDSSLLVMEKGIDDPTITMPASREGLSRFIGDIYAKRDMRITSACQSMGNRYFSPARCPDKLAAKIDALKPDIVHLAWVNGGFMKIETLEQFKVPVIWTMHDMWPFTGGCHYDEGCGRFRQTCGNCPVLSSKSDNDLSRRIWERKDSSWREARITAVAPSHWLADMARSSSLFKHQRVEVIPNGIDTEQYKPVDKHKARKILGLPQDRTLVLFSAISATTDKRKGSQLLVRALKKMVSEGYGDKIALVVMGAYEHERSIDFGVNAHYVGHLNDEAVVALVYSATDVSVAPSMQENLSNVVMESLSCGTPVVAFKTGGMSDLIDHQVNGYLAKPFEPDDLATGILWVVNSPHRREMLSQQARKIAVERYAVIKIANRYVSLYQDILIQESGVGVE